jgi:hypothetical protein
MRSLFVHKSVLPQEVLRKAWEGLDSSYPQEETVGLLMNSTGMLNKGRRQALSFPDRNRLNAPPQEFMHQSFDGDYLLNPCGIGADGVERFFLVRIISA